MNQRTIGEFEAVPKEARTMARAIWTGVISFGMVSIPVKLYPATESKDISFHLLHKECHTRVKQLRWCPLHDEQVEWNDTERGYEYAKGQYVVLTEEDFERLPLASKHTIDLSAFVKADEIDPMYYEKAYYLEPDETGVKPYTLLVRALTDKDLTAVAKIAIRQKEHLCALRAQDGVIVLETLLYSDEIREDSRPSMGDVNVSDRELDLAYSLVDAMEEPFEPEKYKDDYRAALMEVIQAKLQGVEIEEAVVAAPTKVGDLMAALKASVEAAKKRKDEPVAAAPTETRAARGKDGKGDVPSVFKDAFDGKQDDDAKPANGRAKKKQKSR
jgi:DNA end-binding protein Ku